MKITKIETLGMVDGPGIRTVIFTGGCPLRCLYCHNPETWHVNPLDPDYSKEDLLDLLNKYRNYYEASGGGVTFSGGEPLLQEELIEILELCRKGKIHTAIDTCGHFKDKKTAEAITKNADLIILDIKHTNPDEYLKLTKQPIDQLFEYIELLNQYQKPVWVRSVIVPAYNDNPAFIHDLSQLIKKINHVTKMELLGYHSLADEKYQRLNIENPLLETPNMDIKKVKALENLLREKL